MCYNLDEHLIETSIYGIKLRILNRLYGFAIAKKSIESCSAMECVIKNEIRYIAEEHNIERYVPDLENIKAEYDENIALYTFIGIEEVLRELITSANIIL